MRVAARASRLLFRASQAGVHFQRFPFELPAEHGEGFWGDHSSPLEDAVVDTAALCGWLPRNAPRLVGLASFQLFAATSIGRPSACRIL
jgi:hypothetical protein